MSADGETPMTWVYLGDDGTFRQVHLDSGDSADTLLALQLSLTATSNMSLRACPSRRAARHGAAWTCG